MPEVKVNIIRTVPGRWARGATPKVDEAEAKRLIRDGKAVPMSDSPEPVANKMISDSEVQKRAPRRKR